MMRKITTTPLLVLAVLSLATGCVGNDASEPASYGKASYSITLGNDMLDAASQVTIKYSDGEKTQSLTIDASSLDGNTWTRTVTADLPADFGFSITFTPKPGSELTRESYALRTTARINIVTNPDATEDSGQPNQVLNAFSDFFNNINNVREDISKSGRRIQAINKVLLRKLRN